MTTYTIVCLCKCGCEQSEVHHIEAETPAHLQKRLTEAMKELGHEWRDVEIVAAFEGKHMDVFDSMDQLV